MAGAERQRPYKQMARAQAKQRTRETLLKAASEAVEHDRWEQASLESVAERAGVTKQTALRHFGSKRGLLDAVIGHASSLIVKERDEARPGDVVGAVASLMRHYERYGEMATRLLPYRDAVVRVLKQDDRHSLVRRTVDHNLQVHEDWVVRTFKPQLAQLDALTRERRTAQLVAICDVYTWKLLRRDIGMSLAEVEAAVVEMIERLVEPDEQAAASTRKQRARPASSGRHKRA